MAGLELPLELPGHPFIKQLIFVAKWAHVDHDPLLAKKLEIAGAFHKGREACVKALKECLPKTPWNWPAYQAMIDAEMGARHFSRDEPTDMVEHLCGKLRSRHHALYRLGQMNEIKHLRPFWQIKAECAGSGYKTLLADDPFWHGKKTPWNCVALGCDCQVHSLSRLEMTRYVEAGCSPGDEAAKEQLKIWEQGEGK